MQINVIYAHSGQCYKCNLKINKHAYDNNCIHKTINKNMRQGNSYRNQCNKYRDVYIPLKLHVHRGWNCMLGKYFCCFTSELTQYSFWQSEEIVTGVDKTKKGSCSERLIKQQITSPIIGVYKVGMSKYFCKRGYLCYICEILKNNNKR